MDERKTRRSSRMTEAFQPTLHSDIFYDVYGAKKNLEGNRGEVTIPIGVQKGRHPSVRGGPFVVLIVWLTNQQASAFSRTHSSSCRRMNGVWCLAVLQLNRRRD